MAVYDDKTQVVFLNIAVAFMFSWMRYMLNNQEIKNMIVPGQVTTMKAMLGYGQDFAWAEGLNMCWRKMPPRM